jgi:EAL domain-containing protein (putative c-di-GMP-specific phosphodiesterase class I)/PleD family two-component response regulator
MSKILCVEDDAYLLDAIAELLRGDGHEVFTAADGDSGLKAAAELRPDLILCDIGLPLIDGYGLLATFRERQQTLPHVPVIFLTGRVDRASRLAALGVGADDFLNKPLDFELLLAMVGSRLRQSQRLQRRYDEGMGGRLDSEHGLRAEERDPLTGLATRDQLVALMDGISNHCGLPCVLAVTIDRLDRMAAGLGRRVGEQIIANTATRLRSLAVGGVTCARIEGGQFALVAPHGLDHGDAVRLANATLLALSEAQEITSPSIGSLQTYVTASVGIAWGEEGVPFDAIIDRAYAASTHAMLKGGNNWATYQPEQLYRQTESLLVASRLRTAIDNNEFEIHYQPKYALCDGKLVGAEALLRWRRPEGGYISPGLFIPVAEDCGLIGDLGTFVLHHALAQLAAWDLEGWSHAIKVAVNVSPRQLAGLGFADMVDTALADSGISAQRLILEITESGCLGNEPEVVESLTHLKKIGTLISADDFGTGYSTLDQLRRLPFHELKIDQSFVRGLPDNAAHCSIVEAVAAMGRRLGMQIVAEGVETAEQLECLVHCGIDIVQGFYLARPMPGSEFRKMAPLRISREGLLS